MAADGSIADASAAPDRPAYRLGAAVTVTGALLIVFALDRAAGALGALGAVAVFAYLARMRWLAASAAIWACVVLAVFAFAGPYDSWAGRAAVPVLAGYALCFLGGWAAGRRVLARVRPPARRSLPVLRWPTERRLRVYLLALLAVGLGAAYLRFHGAELPLFAANPDVARAELAKHADIVEGLLSEAWTLGMAVSLLRALTGDRRGRWLYAVATAVFMFGAALGASKNSVLVGLIPAVIAALSVRRGRGAPEEAATAGSRAAGFRLSRRTAVILGIGAVAVGAAVFLGGQRTLAGTGVFEDEFRARYGDNALAASVASLDLSLSSSAETFGRLWEQRESQPLRWGAYSLKFLGSRAEPIVGRTDLYGLTSQLSMPYYMNTATFAAIPLLDFGPIGAAVFLLLLGLAVGIGDLMLEFASGPAQQLGRGFIVYFAFFGIYELFPAIYPTWLSIVPGLWVLHRLSRAPR